MHADRDYNDNVGQSKIRIDWKRKKLRARGDAAHRSLVQHCAFGEKGNLSFPEVP